MARTRERKNVKKQLEKRNHVFIEKGRPINDDILCWVNKHSRWQFSNTQYHFVTFRSHLFKEYVEKYVCFIYLLSSFLGKVLRVISVGIERQNCYKLVK